jgi:hypothetical protein
VSQFDTSAKNFPIAIVLFTRISCIEKVNVVISVVESDINSAGAPESIALQRSQVNGDQ